MRGKHVDVAGGKISFRFRGKSGKEHVIDVEDRRLAAVVRRCQELPGQQLFHYVDQHGEVRGIESADVNAYLREAAGDDFSAKDFRTWYGTLLAARALGEHAFSAASSLPATKHVPRQKHVRGAIAWVASKLGNTPSVCRKSYVHPAVITRYLRGDLEARRRVRASKERATAKLDAEERALLALLKAELAQSSQTLETTLRASIKRVARIEKRAAAKNVRRHAA
jgi:DNA topoisomerase-1